MEGSERVVEESTLQYLTFNEVGTAVAAIAVACAFIVLVRNAVHAMKEWAAALRKPSEDRIRENEAKLANHEERISHLEECCTEVRGKLQSDWEWQQSETEMNKLVLKSIRALLKHSVDGNDVDKLKAMDEEIGNYLVDHQK